MPLFDRIGVDVHAERLGDAGQRVARLDFVGPCARHGIGVIVERQADAATDRRRRLIVTAAGRLGESRRRCATWDRRRARYDNLGARLDHVWIRPQDVRANDLVGVDAVALRDLLDRLALLERVQHAVGGQNDQVLANLQQVGVADAVGCHQRQWADAVLRREHAHRLAFLYGMRDRFGRFGWRDGRLEDVVDRLGDGYRRCVGRRRNGLELSHDEAGVDGRGGGRRHVKGCRGWVAIETSAATLTIAATPCRR